MARRSQLGTNAADTAPGVDDGRVRASGPQHTTKPGGRGRVWLAVAIVVAIILGFLIFGSQRATTDAGASIGAAPSADVAGGQQANSTPSR